MFGAISNKELEIIDNYFKQFIKFISYEKSEFDYIESNIEKPMTLEELATVANFSKFHFNRIFQSIVGETPFQFILRVRIEKAAMLILNNKKESISEIITESDLIIQINARSWELAWRLEFDKMAVKIANRFNKNNMEQIKEQVLNVL